MRRWLVLQLLPLALPSQGPHRFDPARDTTGALGVRTTIELRSVARSAVIDSIARRAGLSWSADATLPGLRASVSFRAVNERAGRALARLAEAGGLELLVTPQGSVVFRPETARAAATLPSRRVLVDTTPSWRLAGRVRNARSLEPLGETSLLVNGVPYTANASGLFSIPVPEGHVTLRARAIGYVPRDTILSVVGHQVLDLALEPRAFGLAPVLVRDSASAPSEVDPSAVAMGVSSLSPRERRAAPTLLGEPDPMRDLTTLTGIATATDASTAVSVRGGRTDGNLLLLDGAPIYNPSHVFGLLSTLHAEATDAITVYKGTAPARYGGRLSSVIEVRQREGNGREVEGSASVGLLSSRALVEGPVSDRGAFMVAGRRSYADLIYRTAVDQDEEAIAYFYDLNGKLTWRTSATGTLTASGYLGRDRFGIDEQEGADWGNTAGALRWSQVLGRRLLSTVTLSRAAYNFGFNINGEVEDSLQWEAAITSTDLRVEQRVTLGAGRTIDFGGEVALLKVEPGANVFGYDLGELKRERRLGRSGALYASHEVGLGARLSAEVGLRWSGFQRVGPATLYRYDGAPLAFDRTLGQYVQGRVVDSTRVTGAFGGTAGLEPRLGLRYALNETSSLKASVTRHRQYLHLGSGSAVPLPTDVFEPVGPGVRPMVGDQVAVGYARQQGSLEWSLELWLRRSRNLVEYLDGADVTRARQTETVVERGEGRARGAELFMRWRGERGTWWVSYTLSRAEERFLASVVTGPPGPQVGGFNGGEWFPAHLDRTHQLAATGTWRMGARWELGSTFTATSGLPTTLPRSTYVLGGRSFNEYASRNGARLPAYHRLDLGATRRLRQRGSLQFGIVNAYHRFNPQYASVRPGRSGGVEQLQYSVFRAVPSISYAWRF